ncbi:MAG: molybdopterin-guanine dinucleotide biosynthesis protein B [Proteobacteria bacterium]|nr:molybdopterin-guanine dinucleotide biosynthesis protein B [Pseudomonadota bacterium]
MSPKLISFVGRSDSGKTTLLTRLIPLFSELGLKTGTVKHTHHQVEFDQPGKDSWKHRQAGSSRVLLLNDAKLALFADLAAQPSLREIANEWFADFDLVVSEGYKNEECLKIEVYRQANRKPPLYPNPAFDIQALVSDASPSIPLPHFGLDDAQGVFQWICRQLKLGGF